MKLLKFNEFSNESSVLENLTEFGFNHMGATGITGGSGVSRDTTQPNDPNLTTDGWDRHKNNIMNAQNRLTDIIQSIFNVDAANGRRADKEFTLESAKINRMYRNPSGGVDIYLEFTANLYPGEEFNAVFRNWGSNYQPKFTSTLFEKEYNKMFQHKVKGNLQKALEKWFRPKYGDYLLLKRDVELWNNMGQKESIKQGDVIEVEDVFLENYKPTIHVSVNGKQLHMSNLDYWYFNWWFEPIKKEKSTI